MSPTATFAADSTRDAIGEALPRATSGYGRPPEPKYLYLPLRHLQALSPECSLVLGIRGAGKSVWWAALQSQAHREVVAGSLGRPVVQPESAVSAGFGEENRIDDYPDKRTLRQLLDQRVAPAQAWRTVIAWHTWAKEAPLGDLQSWAARAAWVDAHPEDAARGFKTYDDQLTGAGRIHLVLFDALDRSADRWQDLRLLLRGLLETLLEFRSYRAIRAKAFVRPDMLADPDVTAFRDASKVTANQVELRWSRTDLYGLLWQHLANGEGGGGGFRASCEELGSTSWRQNAGVWQVPKTLRDDPTVQRRVFHAIAGQWMGRDHRRGFPYTWLPNHLADAADQVSPRSFLAAVRTAAENSAQYGGATPLHFEGIKHGVQAASRIRVDEVKEDFYWLPKLMEPLRGLVIPCGFDEIDRRWRSAKVVETLRQQDPEQPGLPPRHLVEGSRGLKRDMIELAWFSEQRDGRVNMPDVYRVGFGLGRKGGVKPIR